MRGRGTAMLYGNHKAAGRQKHLQADLPRSLGALPAGPSAVPGSPRAGRPRQDARLWHSRVGLHHVSVPALLGRETGGVQLQYWGLRGPAGAPAPESPDVWPAHQPVDARTCRQGQFRPGPHPAAGQRRNHSSGPPPLARVVETCQPLDHSSRSSLRPKKKRRDRLIQRAMAHPSWALGFGDEVWWSRLAQPNQHAWTEADATYKLQELTLPLDDPDPKALACYGLLVRP